ncbi:MAG: hypothetical protein AB8B89_05115 [Gammaproteobacteria bacterium]
MWQSAILGQAQGIWFWAAIYIFILCVYSTVFQIRTRYWPYTKGDLVEFDVEKFGASVLKTDQIYTANTLYNYVVSGVKYEGRRISPWLIVASHNARFILRKQMSSVQKCADGKAKVFYKPSNPKKSFLIVASKLGIFITIVMGVLPLLLFYFRYHI